MKIIRNLIIGVFIILMGFLVLDVHVFAEEQTNNGITLTYKVHKEGESYNLLKPTFDGEPFYDKDTNSFKTFVKEYPNINEIIISHIPNAQCNHYSFAGWYYQKGENEFILRRNARFYEDTTFYAKWKPTPRFINYHLNGGINSLGNPKIYNASKGHLLEDPVKEGSTFLGWYLDNEFTNIIETINVEEQGTDTVNVYAKWEINSYQVKYHPNGGEGAMANSIHTYDVSQKLSKNTFTKVGHTFIGWSTTQDGEKYFDDEEEVINLTSKNGGTFDLYAKWEINSYKVTFNTDGGNPTSGPREIEYGKNIITPQEPIKIGYTFSGWYSDESYSNSWDFAVDTMPANDLTLHAKFIPNTYQVEYHSNGGSGTMANSTHTYDEEKKLTPNAFTRTGYSFIGWSTTKNGEVNYSDEQIILNLTSIKNDIVNLYAIWQINTYTVTFIDYNNDELKVETVNYGENANAPVKPSRTGHTFSGWDKEFTNIQTDITVTALYTINEYTITFDSDGGTEVADITLEYEASITKPNDPTKAGYTFTGWNPTLPPTMPANDISVTAQWTANMDTSYKVEHYQRDVNLTTYTLKDTDNLKGTTGAQTVASEKSYAGFTAQSFTQSTIQADGSTIIKIYYDRNSYTITFNSDGGTEVADITLEYGASITKPNDPTKAGYTFTGWNPTLPPTMPANDISVTAQWTANTDTAYKVEHYQQNITGTGYTLKDTDNLTGTTATTVTATTKTYTGFTQNQSHQDMIVSGNIHGDGSLVLRLYYDRNNYTVTFKDHDNEVLKTETVRYGANATPPSNPTRTGYTFASWQGTYTNVTSVRTIIATYTADMTAYKVEHYQQNITGTGYTLKDTDSLIGTTDSTVTATTKTYTGFTENTTHGSRVISGKVAADGSLELRRYYDRDTFTVTFKDHDNEVLKTETVRYGANATPPSNPTRTGYTFASWSGTYANVTSGRKITATYTANTDTAYKVEHYQQNITGTGYTLKDTDNLTGTTDSTVTATTKTYTGFTENTTHSSRVISGKVAADGSLILRRYYDRDKFTVEFKDYDNEVLKTETVRYQGDATPPSNPTRTGYTFDSWQGTYTNVTSGQTVKSRYSIITYSITYDLGFVPTYTNRDTMITDFLTDFHSYLRSKGTGPSNLNTFMHGKGKTSGFDGTYDNYISHLRTLNNRKVFSSGGFVNQRQYNKWVPLVDLMDRYVTAVNIGQAGEFWSSDYTAGLRFKSFIQKDTTHNSSVTSVLVNEIPKAYSGGSVSGNTSYNVESATFNLPTPTKTGNWFLGWYTNSNCTTGETTKINKGTTGNKKFYAKWVTLLEVRANSTSYDSTGKNILWINKLDNMKYWYKMGFNVVSGGKYKLVGKGYTTYTGSANQYLSYHPDCNTNYLGLIKYMYDNITTGQYIYKTTSYHYYKEYEL